MLFIKNLGWLVSGNRTPMVVGDKDVVILKSIEPPSLQDFDEMISQARTRARQAGLKESDIQKAIKKARG